MDLNLLFPSRFEVASWLLLFTVPSLLAIYWSRRALLAGARTGRTVMARIFLGLGATLIGLVVLSLVYPHQHHNTLWIPSHPRLGYPIDVAIGLIIAIAAVAAWNLQFRETAGRPER
jgi:hypothetical protein